jgi:hypothetical protein
LPHATGSPEADPIECPDEGGGGKEVAGEFIVARCDAPPVLDAAEIVFDPVASTVEALGTVGFLGCIAAAGDDRQGAFVLDLVAHFLAIVSLIGGDGERRSGRVEHLADDLAVMHLSARHREVQRAAFAVDDRVNLRRAAAAADPDRLIALPPFAPLAARCAFTIVLSIRCRLSRDFAANVSKIRFHIPRRDHRLKRL